MGAFRFGLRRWKIIYRMNLIKYIFEKGKIKLIAFQSLSTKAASSYFQIYGKAYLAAIMVSQSNRQFQQQSMKVVRRVGVTSQPIPNNPSNSNIILLPTKTKRSASLRPILSCKAVPATATATISDLPPIRSTLALNRPPHPFPKNRRQSSNLGFDGRILTREVRGGCEASREACFRREGSVQVNGLSRQALYQRKESHLNTYFNQRKNRLKEITQENKKIYVRINSQKSLYSSRQLNSSIDSQRSRRLSSSKISSASRKSNSSRASRADRARQKKGKEQVKIESLSINCVGGNQVHRYLNIFCNNTTLKQKGQPLEKPQEKIAVKTDKQNNKYSLASILTKPAQSKLQLIAEQFAGPRRRANLPLSRLL